MEKFLMNLTEYVDDTTGICYGVHRTKKSAMRTIHYFKKGRPGGECQLNVLARFHDPRRTQQVLDDWADMTGKRYLSSRKVKVVSIEPDDYRVIEL